MEKILIVGGIIQKEDKLLLVKHKKKFKDMWSIPGGKVENNESISKALRREIFEETHMRVRSEKSLGSFESVTKNRNLVFFLFECKVSGKFSQNEEIKDFRWINTNRAKELDLKPGMKEILDFIDNKNQEC